MSKWHRLWFAVVALCVLLSGMSIESMASEPEGFALKDESGYYSYTITLYVGNQGEFTQEGFNEIDRSYDEVECSREGGRIVKIVIPYVKYSYLTRDTEQRVHLPDPQELVQLPKDSKYYVKGIRLSGRDNNTAEMEKTDFVVESDLDYVIAYGVKGDMVSYQVNYRDEAGNTLYPSVTYYGNVGDKPVVAFRYVEGYEPQAYNLTRTLQKDESRNEFTFVYRRVATGGGTTTVIDEGTTVTTVPGSTTTTQGGTGGNAGGGGAGAGEGNGDAGTEAETGENTEDNTENIPDAEVPMAPGEVVDLDEPEVPLAKLQNLIVNPEGKVVYGASILIGLSAAAALIIMGVVFWKKRRAGAGNEEIDNWELK